MTLSQGFAPIYQKNARILVLGSMPGTRSLKVNQYYAHPRNCFWKLISELHGEAVPNNYSDRIELISRNHIALWDVLWRCQREGSLDSRIVAGSEEVNDFESLLAELPELRRIVFNGKKAEQVFNKFVAKTLTKMAVTVELICLPSTSPANASISYEKKRSRWREAIVF